MALEKTASNESTNIAWIRSQIEKKDVEIAKNWEKIGDLYRVQIENNQILNALSVQAVQQDEKISEIRESINHLDAELQHIKKQDKQKKANEETADKICRIIFVIFMVGLIVAGIVIGVIRYA